MWRPYSTLGAFGGTGTPGLASHLETGGVGDHERARDRELRVRLSLARGIETGVLERM